MYPGVKKFSKKETPALIKIKKPYLMSHNDVADTISAELVLNCMHLKLEYWCVTYCCGS